MDADLAAEVASVSLSGPYDAAEAARRFDEVYSQAYSRPGVDGAQAARMAGEALSGPWGPVRLP